MKYELQNLIEGKGGDSKTNFIQQITSYLRCCKEAGAANEGKEHTKQQEEKCLIEFVESRKLWYSGIISEHTKIGQGAEQQVYYNALTGTVLKTNDSIFYAFWIDYFNSLIIHNYFFPDTAYTIVGFRIFNGALFVVLEQPHVIKTEDINLEIVKEFLMYNGFKNTVRNDYYNEQLGIILEDLHDENVISCHQVPFFIDTVFYITDKFYQDINVQ